ncbi:hypothetical protein [Spirosoma koreense]
MKSIFNAAPALLPLLICLLVQCKSNDSSVTPKSSAKSLDSPAVDGVTGATSTFDAATNSFTMTVPGGTDLTALKFTFTLPAGATAKPASGSVQNFTNPVTYIVTAEDGSTQNFTVRVAYKTTWASSQDRYEAIRLKAQRVAGVTVSSSIPGGFSSNAPITDADVAYIVNTADFIKSYSDSKATSWQAIDKTKLEYYSVSLTLATGELRVDKGVDVKFDQNGNFYSYKPSWALFYSK